MSTMHEFDPNYLRPTDTPKFTSGPWKRQTRTGANRWRIVDARGHQVTDINHYNAQAEGNADLIAAAPELYEACSALLDQFEQRGCSTDQDHPDRVAVEKARAALAKVAP